mgnify:CR=1 FL=1
MVDDQTSCADEPLATRPLDETECGDAQDALYPALSFSPFTGGSTFWAPGCSHATYNGAFYIIWNMHLTPSDGGTFPKAGSKIICKCSDGTEPEPSPPPPPLQCTIAPGIDPVWGTLELRDHELLCSQVPSTTGHMLTEAACRGAMQLLYPAQDSLTVITGNARPYGAPGCYARDMGDGTRNVYWNDLRTPTECDSTIFPPINGGCPEFPQVDSFQICKCDGTVEVNPPSPPPPQTEAECKSRCRTECHVTPGPPWADGGCSGEQESPPPSPSPPAVTPVAYKKILGMACNIYYYDEHDDDDYNNYPVDWDETGTNVANVDALSLIHI